ncbi:hypothetical protein [Burkholderia stagnalis]|uniref:hypothetical protein n=1 Tax=Burkholderia stagnalis TaxID=1503054 RepID=UPI0012DA38ED|nr:hypothetical protein [Burkholderia stagnalis]
MSTLLRYYRHCPMMLLLHIVGALIAWGAPIDVLGRYPALRTFVSCLGEIFPVVNSAAEKSTSPEVTGLYFSVMYVSMPLRVFDGVRFAYFERNYTLGRISASMRDRIGVLISVSFMFCFGVVALALGRPYYEINVFPISQSRFLLGLVGPIFAGGMEAFGISVGLVWTYIFFSWICSKLRG